MSEKLFYLLGGNGAPNYGDELMAKAWIDFLSSRFAGCRIVLDCNSITSPKAMFPGQGNLDVVRGVKLFCNTVVKTRFAHLDNKPLRFLASLDYGLQFFEAGHFRDHPQLDSVFRAMEGAESLHMFGGGYINTAIVPASGFLIGILAALHRRYGVPVFATGMGVTPLNLTPSHDLGLLIRALSAFRMFECRDSYGFDRLFAIAGHAARIVNGVDDTFLLEYRPAGAAERDAGRTLHLCLLRQPLDGAYGALYHAIEAAAPAFDRVLYWDCVPKLDDRNAVLLRRWLKGMELIDCHALVHERPPVSLGDFMITQRFHPHMIAARLGCGGLFVQEGAYYFDKHSSILHLGSPFRRWNPEESGSPDAVFRHFDGDRGPASILARDAESMARKAMVREGCYGVDGG